MVFELGYLLLEYVVFSDDLDFCLREMLQQGGSYQILRCFDIDWNKSKTNNALILHALFVFQLLPIWDFYSHGIRVLNVKSWGGELSCCCYCFSHSAHWLPTRKNLLYTVANPARGLLNREKNIKKKSGSAPPPPPPPPAPRCSFGEKKKKKKSRGAFTCLGATQVGVTQVVSVRLASVQGFLRLVS